jgi:hypothetical protein
MKSTELKQIILAMMYGDAYTDINYNSGKARLDIYHCAKQYEYLLWKQQVLQCVTGLNVRVVEKVDNRSLVNGNTRKGYCLQTSYSRYLFNLHQTPNKFKIKQLVKPLALAVLWQDDGSLMLRQGATDMIYSSAVLSTDSWDQYTLATFTKYFNTRFGWCMILMNTNNHGGLRMRKDMMVSFSNIIRPYVQPCMLYKLL